MLKLNKNLGYAILLLVGVGLPAASSSGDEATTPGNLKIHTIILNEWRGGALKETRFTVNLPGDGTAQDCINELLKTNITQKEGQRLWIYEGNRPLPDGTHLDPTKQYTCKWSGATSYTLRDKLGGRITVLCHKDALVRHLQPFLEAMSATSSCTAAIFDGDPRQSRAMKHDVKLNSDKEYFYEVLPQYWFTSADTGERTAISLPGDCQVWQAAKQSVLTKHDHEVVLSDPVTGIDLKYDDYLKPGSNYKYAFRPLLQLLFWNEERQSQEVTLPQNAEVWQATRPLLKALKASKIIDSTDYWVEVFEGKEWRDALRYDQALKAAPVFYGYKLIPLITYSFRDKTTGESISVKLPENAKVWQVARPLLKLLGKTRDDHEVLVYGDSTDPLQYYTGLQTDRVYDYYVGGFVTRDFVLSDRTCKITMPERLLDHPGRIPHEMREQLVTQFNLDQPELPRFYMRIENAITGQESRLITRGDTVANITVQLMMKLNLNAAEVEIRVLKDGKQLRPDEVVKDCTCSYVVVRREVEGGA